MAGNNPFKPATKQNKRIKMLLYGESGTGKTVLALKLASLAGGKTALIDMEGGADLYAGADGFPAFDVLRTKNYQDVMNALDYIAAAKHEYNLLILDPITILWNVIVDGFQIMRQEKGITQADWGIIKRKMYSIYNRLVNLPVHVIVIARAKDETEGKDDNKHKIGEKPDAEKSISYLFDVILNVQRQGVNRFAMVDKDRSRMLGARIDKIAVEAFKDLFSTGAPDGGGDDYHQDSEEDAAKKMAQDFAADEKRAQPVTKTPPTPQQIRDAGNALESEQNTQGEITEPPATNGNGNHAPVNTPRTPEQLKEYFQAKLTDGSVKGVMAGTLSKGQQVNLNTTMSDFFKTDALRYDFFTYHFSDATRLQFTSSEQLHDREMQVIKHWLTNTDGEQVAKEVKLFSEMLVARTATAAAGEG